MSALSGIKYYAVKFAAIQTASTVNQQTQITDPALNNHWIPAAITTYDNVTGETIGTTSTTTSDEYKDMMIGRVCASHLEDALGTKTFNPITGQPIGYQWIRFLDMLKATDEPVKQREKLESGKVRAGYSRK
jgi:hypothetical protein